MHEERFPGIGDAISISASAWTERLRLDNPDIVIASYSTIEATKRENGQIIPPKGLEKVHKESIARIRTYANIKRTAAISSWIVRNPTVTIRGNWNISHNT